MTNEQLAVLLDGIASELSEAIEQARDLFDRPGTTMRMHQPPSFCFNPQCAIPEHFQEITVVEIPELVPLETLHGVLVNRIERLTIR